jgi:hypothetical protein
MPRALMTISGAHDGLFTIDSMKGAIRTLERTHAKAGIPKRYRGDPDDTPLPKQGKRGAAANV